MMPMRSIPGQPPLAQSGGMVMLRGQLGPRLGKTMDVGHVRRPSTKYMKGSSLKFSDQKVPGSLVYSLVIAHPIHPGGANWENLCLCLRPCESTIQPSATFEASCNPCATGSETGQDQEIQIV